MAGSAEIRTAEPAPRRVVDVHTHNFSPRFIELLREHPDAHTRLLRTSPHETISYRGSPFVRLSPAMTDVSARIAAMDAAGVDVAILSLTAPNVYWGDRETSIAAARIANDDFAATAAAHPHRIRWMASLPWQHPEAARAELERALALGAVGVCMLTNIVGAPLDDERFGSVWSAIQDAAAPVFIHPTVPFVDVAAWNVDSYGLGNSVGFTSDTTLAFARLILSGFMDRFPSLELIACHGGGSLPYLIARMDQIWRHSGSPNRSTIAQAPSTYLRRFWYDAIVYDAETLRFLVQRVGADRVLYGSDYPFSIQDMQGVKDRVESLPEEQRTPILGGNAAQLFRLDG